MVIDLQFRINEMKLEIQELKDGQERNERYLKMISASLDEARDNHEALRKTFNSNVDKDNDRLRRQRTAAGLCGTETVWRKDGSYVVQNKDCPAPVAK